MDRLAGKVAVVTGAGGRIGGAVARVFAREGASVVVVDLRDAEGEQTVADINANGGTAVFCHADVRRGADVEAMVDRAVEAFGRLDVLVNNAGGGVGGRVIDLTEEQWDHVLALNLKSVFFGAKYAAPVMARGGGGSIVNTSSVNGVLATPGLGAYNAAKAGVINLTRVLALELAMDGIRVNTILPGHIEDHTPHSDPETLKAFVKATPMGRYGFPEEIAAMALFLASDESSFATGASFTVDGGLSAQVAETLTVPRFREFDHREI